MAVLFNPDKLKFSLIVAACNNMGIGKDGKLPWDIPKEMQFFKKMTTKTKSLCKINAVVMGRRTWEGIPQKFRPLKGRINVIVSTTLNPEDLPGSAFPTKRTDVTPGGRGDEDESLVKVCRTWDEALDYLCSIELKNLVENVWIIGGNSLYQTAARSLRCEYIYLTRILADFDCDVFFPADDIGLETKFRQIPEGQAQFFLGVPAGQQEDNGVTFKYEVYHRRSGGEDEKPASTTVELMEKISASFRADALTNPDHCWLEFLGVGKKEESDEKKEHSD